MKKIALVLFAAFCANAAHSAYLYWQVDSSDYSGVVDSATYAQVVAIDTESEETTVLNVVGTDSGSMIEINSGYAAISLDQLTNYKSYSFYVELYNYNSTADTWDMVAHSRNDATTYADLVKKSYVDVGDTMHIPQVQNVWHGGTYSVPEPTSALLVMMGVGLLALKRRRV